MLHKQRSVCLTVGVMPPVLVYTKTHTVARIACTGTLLICTLLGKIGIWGVSEPGLTLRASANRGRNISCTKDVSCTGKFHAKLLKDKLFPILEQKWPTGDIRVQTDNAKVQVGAEAREVHVRRFKMARQPPNSPDTNPLDEGIFHSLQVYVDSKRPGHGQNKFWQRKDLETAIEEAWNGMPGEKIMKTMAHMVDVMRAILSVNGGNRYKRASKFAIGSRY